MSAKQIIDELKTYTSDERKKINECFFKTGPGEYSEYDQFIGVRVPNTRKVAKKYFQTISYSQLDILLDSPIHEVRHLGLIILVNKYQANKKTEVFNYYISKINFVNNWDLVDTTTPHIVGDYIFHHPDKLSMLYHWAKSDNLWERRIAIVATFAFIKQGKFDTTLTIAKELLSDKQDLIHKAVGWMLREIYKKDQSSCITFLQENYAQLPRTTLRYAIERMNEIERKAYLKGIF